MLSVLLISSPVFAGFSNHLILKLGQNELYSRRKAPASCQFEIPQVINSSFRSGLQITFGADGIRCTYVPQKGKLVLAKCLDWHGGNLGDVEGHVFGIYEGEFIEVRRMNVANLDKLRARISVEWR